MSSIGDFQTQICCLEESWDEFTSIGKYLLSNLQMRNPELFCTWMEMVAVSQT
jgi:hypothetical protein